MTGVQTCALPILYHGTSQEEIDPTTENGRAFLQMLSSAWNIEGYSFEYSPDSTIVENYLKNLEASAAENNENYYILLEFSVPPDILLEDKERNSTITIYHYDKIIFEVDRAGKRLLLNTHDKDNETLIFLPTIGRHKQNAVKHFLQEYNTRNQGSQGQLF